MTYTIVNLATPEEMSSAWCMYTLLDKETAKTVYVGHCLLSEVFNMPDARLTPSFDEGKPVILRVGIIALDKIDVKTAAQEILNKDGTPPWNRAALCTRNSAIKCIDTGEVFASVKEAVKAHGLTQSALSNHLNGKKGYKQVKGRTYRRWAG